MSKIENMKKILLSLLCICVLSQSFGQSTIDIEHTSEKETYDAQARKFAIKNTNISSSFYLNRYSKSLIAKEILLVAGATLTYIGIKKMSDANLVMSQNAVGSNEYKWAKTDFSNAQSIATIGGISFLASYTIHLSSLGSLRKFALKKRYEELNK